MIINMFFKARLIRDSYILLLSWQGGPTIVTSKTKVHKR